MKKAVEQITGAWNSPRIAELRKTEPWDHSPIQDSSLVSLAIPGP